MNKFYLIGKLSQEYVKGYMSNPEQDRTAIVGSAAEKAGGKLHSLEFVSCLLYTSPSPRDLSTSRMPSSA